MSISKRVKTQRVQYKESTDDYFVVDQTTKEIIYGPDHKQDCEAWVEVNPDLAVNVVVLQGEEDNGVLVTEATDGFDDQWVRDRMGVTAEELGAEFDVDLDAVKAAADKVAAGGYLYGGSPVAYFAKNGFVFDGEFEAFSSPAQLASAILVAAAESGLASFEAVASKADFPNVYDWDKDPVAHELAHFNVKEASSLTESDGVIAAAQQADATAPHNRQAAAANAADDCPS